MIPIFVYFLKKIFVTAYNKDIKIFYADQLQIFHLFKIINNWRAPISFYALTWQNIPNKKIKKIFKKGYLFWSNVI